MGDAWPGLEVEPSDAEAPGHQASDRPHNPGPEVGLARSGHFLVGEAQLLQQARAAHACCLGAAWLPKGIIVDHTLDMDLPKPVLRAYAFTERSWDVPQPPNGTDLWVQGDAPNQFEIWFSQLNWQDCLDTGEQGREYTGVGYWRKKGACCSCCL